MICNRAGQTELDMDQLSVTSGEKSKVLIRADLSPSDVLKYDAYVDLFCNNLCGMISNYGMDLSVVRFSNNNVIDSNSNNDYSLLNDEIQLVIDNFVSLLNF